MPLKTLALLILSVLFLASCTDSKQHTEASTYVFKDVDHFYKMLDLLPEAKTYKDTLQILNEYYFDRSSTGLQTYFKYERNTNKRDLEQAYYKVIKSYPKYFESQKQLLLESKNHTSTYTIYLNKIKEVYPQAKFQPTYFSIGFFNTPGQMIYPNTVFIGLEASLKTDSTDYSEFSERFAWLKQEQGDYKSLGYTIVHEQLHTFQNSDPDDFTILTQTITEGAAVFLTAYFCGEASLVGSGIDQAMVDYEKENQTTVWKEFQQDLDTSENSSAWFWNEDSKYPYSMGYYMGYLICKSFYEKSADKEEALKTLIEVKNPVSIYEQSSYSSNSL